MNFFPIFQEFLFFSFLKLFKKNLNRLFNKSFYAFDF